MQNLLRPVVHQSVAYSFYRGRDRITSGSGWVERIVADEPGVSTYFTPIAITINVDSFEHLEFETRPDQLLVYTLVQGDERVVLEYVPGPGGGDDHTAEGSRPMSRQLELAMGDHFVQMELLAGDDPSEE
jgi:hypothetical protein